MGQSRPPRAAIDLVQSYARLRGEDVELVLAGRVGNVQKEHPEVVLHKGRRRVVASGELLTDDGERRLVARVRREELTDGSWQLVLRAGSGPRGLKARLLVQGERPLVLLWGATGPDSRLPVPHARAAVGRSSRLRRLVKRLRRA